MTDQHLISLEELNLSVRTYNCLKSAQVNSVSDLVSFSYEDLLEIKNFGPASAEDVITALDRIGMNLRLTTPYLELFSPAARAVLVAYYCGGCGKATRIAAALRAVAEQLVPQMYVPERFYSGEDFEEYARQMTRQHLLAIADELEG
jgi:hypothetical protein